MGMVSAFDINILIFPLSTQKANRSGFGRTCSTYDFASHNFNRSNQNMSE
jgi:hypothetical protein